MIKRVLRYDSPGALGTPKRTDEGFFLSSGKLAKPGVMPYKSDDDTTIFLELVDEDVLSNEVSNATLEQKAFTIEHPEDDVTPDNWSTLAHGDVTNPRYDAEHPDGPGLYVDLAGKTRAILTEIEKPNGKNELSPGYTVEVDDTPGVHPVFGKYDTRQIPGTRRYNHVALTEGARGGRDLQLRKDSAIEVAHMNNEPKDENKGEASEEKNDAGDMQKIMDKLDAMQKQIDELKGAKKDATGEESAEQGAESVKPAEPKEDMKSKTDSADFMTRFAERTELIEVAQKFGVEVEATAENDSIRTAIVEAVAPTVNRKDAAEVRVAYAMITSGKLGMSVPRDTEFEASFVPTYRRADSDEDFAEAIDYDNDFFSNLG